MIPTPELSHLTREDYEHVYEPAEDTFILLDAIEEEADELRQLHPLVCLEIGSGSGCVSAFVGNILGPSTALYLCTDINAHASRCTIATGRVNKVPLESINTSLAAPLSSRLKHSIDILLFNPPYVPTITHEAENAQHTASIAGSWAGGIDGMQITNTFLQTVEDLLSARGRFYLVAMKENNIPNICARMSDDHGLKSRIIMQRRAGREHLFVVRFFR